MLNFEKIPFNELHVVVDLGTTTLNGNTKRLSNNLSRRQQVAASFNICWSTEAERRWTVYQMRQVDKTEFKTD